MAADAEIMWKDAFLTFGISDLKGVKAISGTIADDRPLIPEPGLPTKDLVQTGITFRMPLSAGQNPGRIKFEMSMNGSEEIRIVPLGKETKVSANSSWVSPSFVGDFLPEKREITPSSFNASWKVLHLNRNLPQAWVGPQPNLETSSFGVKLLLPVDEYQKNMRAVKYALISIYTQDVTGRWVQTAVVTAVLAILYCLLFILLQLEDYALLLGSISLFASLASVMYLTRGIDWFGLGRAKGSQTECSPDRTL